MKKLLLAGVSLLALALPGLAADLMPLKAPVLKPIAYPYTTSGFYGGLTTYLSVQTVNVNTPVVGANGALSANGGSIGGVLGYSIPIFGGAEFAALEGSAAWQNIGGQSTSAISFTGPARLELLAKIGMPFAQFLADFPTLNLSSVLPTLPAVPAGLTTTNAHIYLGAGFAAEDISATIMGQSTGTAWSLSGVARFGTIWQLTSGAAVDTWVEYEGNGKSIGVTPAPGLLPGVEGQTHKALAGVSFLL